MRAFASLAKDNSGGNANFLDGNYVSDEACIVIGGSGRSGTTLLRVMLDSHRDICCGPESWLFIPNEIDTRTLARNFDIDHGKVEDMYQRACSRAEFIEHFFSEYCHVMGKRRWAEKTPRNIEQLGFIFRAFPRSRFVHIIRDGRDVACSLRTHPRFSLRDGKLIPTNTWKPLEKCIDRWTTAIRSSRDYRSDPRYLEIRYEDLVREPRSTLEKLLLPLGEPWDDRVLRYYETRSASRDVARFPQNPEATAPIKRDSIGRWKHDFSETDKAAFKQMAGELLIYLGYESSNDW